MRVKAIRDCFVGSYRKAGEEFDHSGPENRNLQPLGGAKWSKQASSDLDYGKAALLLQSRGYEADTPEAAQKFVDGLSKKNRASFLADLAVFDPASSSDDDAVARTDGNVNATEGEGATSAEAATDPADAEAKVSEPESK